MIICLLSNFHIENNIEIQNYFQKFQFSIAVFLYFPAISFYFISGSQFIGLQPFMVQIYWTPNTPFRNNGTWAWINAFTFHAIIDITLRNVNSYSIPVFVYVLAHNMTGNDCPLVHFGNCFTEFEHLWNPWIKVER